MKSAVISSSDIDHISGRSCMKAARWCEGKCDKAQKGKCPIWEAGDCTATLPVRLRRVGLLATDTEYEKALRVLQEAGFTLQWKGGEKNGSAIV